MTLTSWTDKNWQRNKKGKEYDANITKENDMNIKALEYSALNTNYIIEQFTEFTIIMTLISTLFECLGVKLFERIRKCDLLEEMCHCRWALRLQKPKQCPMSLSSSFLHIWIKNFQFFLQHYVCLIANRLTAQLVIDQDSETVSQLQWNIFHY